MEENSNSKKSTTLNLYQLMKDIHELFENFNITYWIDGGTMLGAYRHKGIIPWDDDLDISIFDSKENINILKSKKLKKELKKLGYGIISTAWGYKIYLENGLKITVKNKWKYHVNQFKLKHPEIKGRSALYKAASKTYNKNNKSAQYLPFKYPFIDIFLAKEENGKIIYTKDKDQWWVKDCWHKKEDFFNLKEYPFGELSIYGPKNPKKYFDDCYGSNWNNYAYRFFDHKEEKTLEKKKFKLKKSNRVPAQPTGPLKNRVSKKKK